MDSRLLATIIIFPIWLTLVIVFRRHRQWFLYYMIAAFGLTMQVVLLAEHFGIDQMLVNMASFHVELISKYLFKIQMELLSNGRFQLLQPIQGADVLKLGVECSAILESAVVVALVVFYPLFNWKQKILRALFGLVVTYAINIIRLMIIVLMADRLGSEYIFLAHAGVARIFFFLCEVLLYWYLLTKPTVKSVGDSLTHHRPVGEEATVGHSLQLRHAVAQVIVIILILGTVLTTFKVSNEWKIAFMEPVKKVRPIIYKDETGFEYSGDQTSKTSKPQQDKKVLGRGTDIPKEIYSTLNLPNLNPGTQSELQTRINEDNILINYQLIQANFPLTVELYLNNVFQNRTEINDPAKLLDPKTMIFSQNIMTMKNDIVEIRVISRGSNTDDVAINLIGEKYEQ